MRPNPSKRKKDQRISPKKKSVPRAYDNSARAEKSKASQQLILQTLVRLLVEKKGGEVTFEEIAEKTGISARTIYRFYKNKEELHRELNVYLTGYIRDGVGNIESMDVAGFAKYSFELFDRYDDLFTAYVSTSFGQEARRVFRAKLNEALIGKVLAEKPIAKDSESARRIAIIVSLINAKLWHDIRADFGYAGKEMAGPIEWAVRTLIEALDKK